jgi:hypothetical protein
VLAVLLIALLAAVLFALRRPGATLPATPLTSTESVSVAPGSQTSSVAPPAAVPVDPVQGAPTTGVAEPPPAPVDDAVTSKRASAANAAAGETSPRRSEKPRARDAAVLDTPNAPNSAAAGAPPPEADAAGTLPPVETPSSSPAAASAPVQIFDGLKLLVLDGKDAREEDARLHFADGRMILTAVGKTLIASFPFQDVTSLSYSRSRRPRWRNADGTDGRVDISGGLFGFLRPDRSWFVIQTRTRTFIIRAENAQIASLRRASAALTGVAVHDFTER